MNRRAQILAGILWFAALAAFPAQASSIKIYISPPTVQSSEVAGATVENFDSMTPGNRTTSYTSLIGTYNATSSSPFDIITPDQYGGATDPTNPTTPTKYFTIGAQSGTSAPVSLTLKQPADYFGFWLSAADVNNGVSFYNGNLLLARFSTQTLITFLNGSGGSVTSIDKTKTYTTSAYYSDPNKPFLGQNPSEPYVFVDFVATGVTFNKVVFDNSNSIGTGFESDNHTISSAPGEMSGDHVLVGDLSVATPEPAAAILLAGGLMLIAVARRRGLGVLPLR
jgi:hypothetical protein